MNDEKELPLSEQVEEPEPLPARKQKRRRSRYQETCVQNGQFWLFSNPSCGSSLGSSPFLHDKDGTTQDLANHEWVAAGTLDDALEFMRHRHPSFNIRAVKYVRIIKSSRPVLTAGQ